MAKAFATGGDVLEGKVGEAEARGGRDDGRKADRRRRGGEEAVVNRGVGMVTARWIGGW